MLKEKCQKMTLFIFKRYLNAYEIEWLVWRDNIDV